MKILIFAIFLAIPSYAQNFMMQMDIQETRGDSTVYFCNEKVIWGIANREICFLWGDRFPMCFTEEKTTSIKSRRMRESIDYYIKEASKQGNDRHIKMAAIFRNKWGELFLIVMYWRNEIVIIINRIDGKYPHYSFRTILI